VQKHLIGTEAITRGDEEEKKEHESSLKRSLELRPRGKAEAAHLRKRGEKKAPITEGE